jgi:hypothetical protein
MGVGYEGGVNYTPVIASISASIPDDKALTAIHV